MVLTSVLYVSEWRVHKRDIVLADVDGSHMSVGRVRSTNEMMLLDAPHGEPYRLTIHYRHKCSLRRCDRYYFFDNFCKTIFPYIGYQS
jgi:hypothetical protein